MCGQGDWPVEGGLANQSNWFLQLQQRLISDSNLIESERDNG